MSDDVDLRRDARARLAASAAVPAGWPWTGSGVPPAPSARLSRDVMGERWLRALLQKAREADGAVYVARFGKIYSVAQLTVALKKEE